LAAAKNGSNPALLNNQSHISAGKNTTLGGSGGSGLIQQQQRSQIGDRTENAFSHEEWSRRKEHEIKLKENLIKQAKIDILEQVRRIQAEEEVRR
jgi:hypothetical protein